MTFTELLGTDISRITKELKFKVVVDHKSTFRHVICNLIIRTLNLFDYKTGSM